MAGGAVSVTRKEIDSFWKQRRMTEEDHLYAAVKAAARLRARNLTVGDYLRFELSTERDEENEKHLVNKCSDNTEIMRVGIKDWWTRSKFAYLNQPTMKLGDHYKPRSYYMSSGFF